MGVPSSYVFAKDNKRHEEKCTLKNKVFCGEWEDSQGFHTRILGYKITSYDSRPYQSDCQIIDEFIDKKYPYSILKCLYYDDWDKKYSYEYLKLYLSEKTERDNRDSPELEHVIGIGASSLKKVFVRQGEHEDGTVSLSLADPNFFYLGIVKVIKKKDNNHFSLIDIRVL